MGKTVNISFKVPDMALEMTYSLHLGLTALCPSFLLMLPAFSLHEGRQVSAVVFLRKRTERSEQRCRFSYPYTRSMSIVRPLRLWCVTCSLAVVGVKLNVSAWMNSFMNATMKINVSETTPLIWTCGRHLVTDCRQADIAVWKQRKAWLTLINDAKPVWAILSFRLSRFSPCSVRMRSVAVSGMIRYCMRFVVVVYQSSEFLDCLIWSSFFLFAVSLTFTLFRSACGLRDTGWWRLPAHVQSGWIYHTGQSPSAHISIPGNAVAFYCLSMQ